MLILNNRIYIAASVVALTLVAACGSKKSEDSEPVTISGNLTVSGSKTVTDNATVQMTNIVTCSRNADTGRVDVTLSQGSDRPSFSLAIKDYSADPKTYSCTQAADNATSETDVGGKFETCLVAAKVLSASDKTTLNGYSMYRETVATRKFSYTGACSISVTTASPAIVGSFSCTNMIQTTLESAVRNPIVEAITANAAGDFNCTFR